jgi:hypothetical protein
MRMQPLLAAAVVALVAAGCGGSRTGAGQSAPATQVVISYSLGASKPLVTRTLHCRPAGGDYRDPAAACRALLDFAHVYSTPRSPAGFCTTVHVPGAPGIAVGVVDGRRVRLPINPSGACNLGGRAWADLHVLTPGVVR